MAERPMVRQVREIFYEYREAPISGPGNFNHPNSRRDRRQRQPCELLTSHDLDRLKLFYGALNPDERRRRFGAALSSQAVAQHCDRIDWRHSFVIARPGKYFLQAVLELHPLSSAWDRAEVALATGSAGDRLEVFAQLIQTAAFVAASQGCGALAMLIDTTFCEVSPLLREMGRVHAGTDFATIDLTEYAATASSADCPAPTAFADP